MSSTEPIVATPSASPSGGSKQKQKTEGSPPPLAKRMKEVPVLEEPPAMMALAVVAGILAGIAIGMLGYGVQTDSWLEVSMPDDTTIKMGLFDVCTSNVSCIEISFDTMDAVCGSSGTTVEGSAIKQRYWVIRGLFFFEAFGCFVVCVLSLAACQRGATGTSPLLSLLASLLSVLGGAAGVAMWVMSIQGFFFCEKSYCDMVGLTGSSEGCSETFGLSFYVAAASMGPCLIALVLSIVLMIARKKGNADPDGGSETKVAGNDSQPAADAASPKAAEPASPNGDSSTVPVGSENAQSPSQETPPAQPAAERQQSPNNNQLPSTSPNRDASPLSEDALEGDWEFDKESGMYWSESNYLFLNPENGHYYSPNADQWFDPDADKWYTTTNNNDSA